MKYYNDYTIDIDELTHVVIIYFTKNIGVYNINEDN